MLLVDANVLIAAVNADAPQHEPASTWLRDALAGPETVGLAWVVSLAFLRVTTHPSIFRRPLSADEAGGVLAAWLAAPAVVAVDPTPRHLDLLRGLLAVAGSAGNRVNDAHLAVLALEHHGTVVSFDRDFGRFAGVRLRVPGA